MVGLETEIYAPFGDEMTKNFIIVFLLLFVVVGCSNNKLVKHDVVVPTDLAGIDSTISDFKDEGYIITSGPYGDDLNSNTWLEKTDYKIWAWFKNGLCYHIIYNRKDGKELTDKEKMYFIKINFRRTAFRGNSPAEDPNSFYNMAVRRGLKVDPPSPSAMWWNTTPTKIECLMVGKDVGYYEVNYLACYTNESKYGKNK